MPRPVAHSVWPGIEKLAVNPADAGVQCGEIKKINGFWIPACAGMTDF